MACKHTIGTSADKERNRTAFEAAKKRKSIPLGKLIDKCPKCGVSFPGPGHECKPIDEDVMNTCGHRTSERKKAFEEFPSAMCPACLLEQLKTKDEALKRYGSHEKNCHLMYDPPDHPEGRCTCDYEQAMKGIG